MRYELELNDGFYYIQSNNGKGTRIDKQKNETDDDYKTRAIKEFDDYIAELRKLKNQISSSTIKTEHV